MTVDKTGVDKLDINPVTNLLSQSLRLCFKVMYSLYSYNHSLRFPHCTVHYSKTTNTHHLRHIQVIIWNSK